MSVRSANDVPHDQTPLLQADAIEIERRGPPVIDDVASQQLSRLELERKYCDSPPLSQHSVKEVTFEVKDVINNLKPDDFKQEVSKLKDVAGKEWTDSKMRKFLIGLGTFLAVAVVVCVVALVIIGTHGAVAPWLFALCTAAIAGTATAGSYSERANKFEKEQMKFKQWEDDITNKGDQYKNFLIDISKRYKVDDQTIRPHEEGMSEEQLMHSRLLDMHRGKKLHEAFNPMSDWISEPTALYELWELQRTRNAAATYHAAGNSDKVMDELRKFGCHSFDELGVRQKEMEGELFSRHGLIPGQGSAASTSKPADDLRDVQLRRRSVVDDADSIDLEVRGRHSSVEADSADFEVRRPLFDADDLSDLVHMQAARRGNLHLKA